MISYMTGSSRNNFCSILVVPFFIDPQSSIILLPKDHMWIRTTPTYATDFYQHHQSMKIGDVYTAVCYMPGTRYTHIVFVRVGNNAINTMVYNCLLQIKQISDARVYLPLFFLGCKLAESEMTQLTVDGAMQFQKINVNKAQIYIGLINRHPKAVEVLNGNEIPCVGTWNPKDKKFDL